MYNISNLQQAIESGEPFTADEWNWFISRELGSSSEEQPAPEDLGFTDEERYAKVSWDDYARRRPDLGGLGLNVPVPQQPEQPAPPETPPPPPEEPPAPQTPETPPETPEPPPQEAPPGDREPETLEEAIASGRSYTPHEWNWFIQQARNGEQQPDPLTFGFTLDDYTAPISWNDYRSRRGLDETGSDIPSPDTPPEETQPPDGQPPAEQPPAGPSGPPTMIYPGQGDYGHPSSLQPYHYDPWTDSSVEDLLTEDRYYWGSRGEALNNQLAAEIWDQKFRAGLFSGAQEGAYGVPFGGTPEEQQAASRAFAERGGGYTGQEAGDINRTEDLMGLRTSRGEQNRLFFTPDELQGGWMDTTGTVDDWNFYITQATGEQQTIDPSVMGVGDRGEKITYADYIARRQQVEPDWQPVPLEQSSMAQPGIYGDPASVGKYFRPDYLTSVEQSGADVQRGVGEYYRSTLNSYVEDIGNRLRNTVDREGMQLSPQAQSDIVNSLGQGAQAIRAAIDRNRLTMSPDMMQQVTQIAMEGDQRVRSAVNRSDLTMAPQFMQGVNQGLEAGGERVLSPLDRERLTMSPQATQRADQTLREGGDRVRSTMDRSKLAMSPDVMPRVEQGLTEGERRVRSAFDPTRLRVSPEAMAGITQATEQGAGRTRATIDRGALTASPEYLDQYQFGPQDQQRYVDTAATSEGIATQAALDRMRTEAAMSGNVNPLALAAAESRARQTGEVGAGDAVREARVQAKRLGLDTLQQREATRLAAEQGYAGMASQVESDIAARDVATRQWQERERLGAEQSYAGMTSQAEQEIARQRREAQQWGEETRLGSEQRYADLASEAERQLLAEQLGMQRWGEETRLSAEQSYAGMRSQAERALLDQWLGAQQWGEQTRIGAQQQYADLAAKTEQEIANRRLAAQQWGEETRLASERGYAGMLSENEQAMLQRYIAARTQLEQMRMGGARDVTGAYMQTETEAGRDRMESELQQMQARLNTEREIAAGSRGTGQYITGMGTDIAKYAEGTSADRAMQVALNRQQMEQYGQGQRYTQGMETNTAAAQRAQEIAAQRIKAEQEYRSYLGRQQELGYQNQLATQQNQIAGMGTQVQGQGAAGNTLANYKTGMRTNWGQLIGSIAGGVGGILTGAAAFGEGGVVTEPTRAILGERGPELVIPLDPEEDSKVTPDYLMGRRRIPRYVQ